MAKSSAPTHSGDNFDIKKCIIFTKKDTLKSTPNGWTAIMPAASIRQDEVLEQLDKIKGEFVQIVAVNSLHNDKNFGID